MSYLNAERWRPPYSITEEVPPSGPCYGRDNFSGAGTLAQSRWMLELMDEEDQCVRVLIAGDGSDWTEGEDD